MSVRAIKEPFSKDQLHAMQEKDGHVKAVISYPWSKADIDSLNDDASALITGSQIALEDIAYKLVGVDVELQEVFIEVTGTVENWLDEKE